MFSKFIKKLKLYVFPTKDDREFYSLIQMSLAEPEDDMSLITLVDCTHLGFKRWNVQLFCTLLGINNVTQRKFVAFYPSYFFIWNTLQSKIIWIIKKIYNKDNELLNLLSINEKITPSYSRFLLSNYVSYKFDSKEDVINFEYKGIKIGDLIYDSYLKENRKATVDVNSKKLDQLLKKACFLVDFYQNEFSKHNIAEVYLTHAVYLCYGTAARVALKNNIKVYITQNTRGKELHQLTEEHPFQTPNFSSYKQIFDELENPEDRLDAARNEFENRFKGVINSSISYMKETAYTESDISLSCISDETDNLLIMLHCFFDSPHIYKSMLYPDFYEWVIDTIEVALATGKTVFIKEHPNGMTGNDKVVAELKKKFTTVTFLDKKTSNLAIMNCKIDAVASVYGTLGHEFPYKNIPVINAGENPHSSFNFCYNPTSLSEYRNLISKVGSLKKPTDIDKNDILKFYYIHNIFNGKGVNSLINKSIIEKFSPKDDYKEMIDVITDIGLVNYIESSKNSYLTLDT
jgi:hypothetical protein